MSTFIFFRKLSLLLAAGAFSLTASPAYSEGKGKAKAKGKQHVETKGHHGREAGELPFGLQSYMEKKDELPSGLQEKKDENGSLMRGLEEGGKNLKSTAKAKKGTR